MSATHKFEKKIVFRFSNAELTPDALQKGYVDYDHLLATAALFLGLERHDENDAVSMPYTSGNAEVSC